MIMKENKEDIAVILNKDNIKTKKNKKEDEYIYLILQLLWKQKIVVYSFVLNLNDM